MRPLEVLYLVIGVGIVVRGTIDHGLTPEELGASLFFLGLVPVSRADRDPDAAPPTETLRKTLVGWLSRDGEK